MKKLLVLFTVLLLLTGCYYDDEPNYDDGYDDGYEAAYDVLYGALFCDNCHEAYSDRFEFSTRRYCPSCVDEFTSYCCMCGVSPIDHEETVVVNINGKDYPFCVYCIAAYFETIDAMKPFYYCILCGGLTTCGDYTHTWTERNICEDCIVSCEMCRQCEKYDRSDDIHDGLCDWCA